MVTVAYRSEPSEEYLGVEVHPAANLFPMMDRVALTRLVEDIRINGLQQPVALLPDGRLIDGRNRMLACKKIGIEAVTVTVNPEDPVAFAVSANLHRRDLTSEQRAAIAARLVLPALEAQAMEKKASAKRHSEGDGNTVDVEKVRQLRDGRAPRSVERAAEIAGTNNNYVSTAKRILKSAPDLAAKVEAGEMRLREAEAECGERTGTRKETLARAALKRSSYLAGRIEAAGEFCANADIATIQGNQRLKKDWLRVLDDVIEQATSLRKQLRKQ